MDLDLVVRGGTVVDGTGAEPYLADVGISGGLIAEVGRIGPTVAPILEADGCVVAPGFIDPHTHLDAQLCWDPAARPTSGHGVTTVVLGLCGFGVAPCPPGGEEYVLKSLEAVEEIPFESTIRGVPFQWRSWSEYIRFIEGRPLSVNVAAFVPHSTLRFFVMGDRSISEAATSDDIRLMVAELSRSLEDGAIGFSSSRGPNHIDGDGHPVPSRLANDSELEMLVATCRERVWQINAKTKFAGDSRAFQEEIESYLHMTNMARSRLTWTPLHAEPGNGQWRELVDLCDRANERGVSVLPQMGSQPIPLAFRFDQFSYFAFVEGWADVLSGFFDLDAKGKTERLRSHSVREGLRGAPAHGGSALSPRLENWRILISPSNPSSIGRTVADAATELGIHPVDFLCDLVADDGLGTVLQVPVANRDGSAIIEMLGERNVLLGLGDAGAHVQSITNFNYPTQLLADLVRDQQALSLPKAIEHLTSRPANFLGLAHRGRVAPGMAADLTVFDHTALALTQCVLSTDLPGGASRLTQGAKGYVATIVNGQVTLENDRPTGACPGTVVTP